MILFLYPLAGYMSSHCVWYRIIEKHDSTLDRYQAIQMTAALCTFSDLQLFPGGRFYREISLQRGLPGKYPYIEVYQGNIFTKRVNRETFLQKGFTGKPCSVRRNPRQDYEGVTYPDIWQSLVTMELWDFSHTVMVSIYSTGSQGYKAPGHFDLF